ncbi:MAG: hypothetical protein HQM09_08815, partial [Candidatus Riflebacteria bacterium]|nr:hypothetical protein [Candidatus Riflebacteria bacterium]
RDPGDIYKFAVVRADLWAVKNPVWAQPYAGDHPTQAISKSQRTFLFPSGNFSVRGTNYSWGSDGLSSEINLAPALNDGIASAAKASQINFSWIRKGVPQASGTTYVAHFDKPETAQLFLNSTLDFGRDGNILFAQVNFPVTVTPLEDHIVAAIDPQMFSVSAGGQKTLHCLVSSRVVPSRKRDETISLLGGEYTLSMQKDVVWTVTRNQSQKLLRQLISNDYSFTTSQPGSYTITASASLNLQESKSSSPAPATMNLVSATARADVSKVKIVIRRVNPQADQDNYEVGFRKEKTQFKAIAVSEAGESPIAVDWSLEDGLATTDLQLGILKELKQADYKKIGDINGSDTVSQTEEVTFTSYLPGSITLVAAGKGKTVCATIRIKQPTVYLSIKAVDGIGDLSQLSDWTNTTKKIWLQGNNFLNVQIRHGYSVENLPWVNNASFTPAPYPSSEQFFVNWTNGIWLASPLVEDFYLSSSNNNHWIVPRLTRELLSQKRSFELTSGLESDVNIYFISQAWYGIPFTPPQFKPVAGWTICANNYYYPGGNKKIEDFTSSGIVLSRDSKEVLREDFGHTLAHEMGHLLLQSSLYDNSSEDLNDCPDNLMQGGGIGTVIAATQAVMIYDYETKKPLTSRFVKEE